MRCAPVVLFLLAVLMAGCWPRSGEARRPAGGADGPRSVVVDVSGGALSAPRSGRQIVVLDPLDWSGKYLEAAGLKLERRDGAVRLAAEDPDRAAEAVSGALLALRRRLGVIAENLANAETTRAPAAPGDGPAQPYRRKVLTVTPAGVLEPAADPSAFRKAYRPNHPDADKDGSVLLPNVYPAVEEADCRATLREYETLRLALELLGGRYAAPPAGFLPVPPMTPTREEKAAPPAGHEAKPVPAPPGTKPE